MRRKVLQEGKRSLLQISSMCSFIFLTLVFVICGGGEGTQLMCLSLSETEVFARRKPVLVEKTGTGESSDGAGPFQSHLDNNPILSQQGGRSGLAKRLQDAGP